MDFQDQVEELASRFAELADEEEEFPGMEDFAVGLSKIADHLHENGGTMDELRITMILNGLSSLAHLLGNHDGETSSNLNETQVISPEDLARISDPEDHSEPVDQTQVATVGLEQFVETFRSEARKRIQGLSITLMNIFGEEGNEEAMEHTADHLHAIRGGAAMLSLKDVADLAESMEQVVLAKKKATPGNRNWPTKTLLRGFALLQDAVDADPLRLDNDHAPAVIEHLRRAANPDGSDQRPATDTMELHAAKFNDAISEKVAPQNLEQPILIVDDVDTIAASVAFILSELEVPIEIANHGEEAMQMLKERPFSLVISDVDMPRMDGIALTRMIRATEETRQIPVILLTSLDHPEERQAGMEAGATDYLIKGTIGGGELLSKVEDLLKAAPFVKRDVEAKTRRILVAEDTETVAASIAFVLSEGPFDIVLATDGKDALRMLKKTTYDLLITDMQMPYMSGTELVEAVRKDQDLQSLPVVMLTSVSEKDAMARAAEAGVDRYLIKGEIAGGKLLSVVDELLND